jgi:hypothetical protein
MLKSTMNTSVTPLETLRQLDEHFTHRTLDDIRHLALPAAPLSMNGLTPRTVDGFNVRQLMWGAERTHEEFDLLCLTFSRESLTIGIAHRHHNIPQRMSLIFQPSGVDYYTSTSMGIPVEAEDTTERLFRETLAHSLGQFGLQRLDEPLRAAS